jgi:hypothetical protein
LSRATKLSFFQPRVSRYILYMSLSVPPLVRPRRAFVSPIPRRKTRQLLAELPPRVEGGGKVTTNYSGERDSDEMKRSDLAPFSLFLHFSQFALDLCPPFYTRFSGAQISQMSRNARKELVCATFVLFADIGRRRTNDLPPQRPSPY